MIKGVIFDFDGLMVDSETLHFKSYKKALNKFGITLKKKDFKRIWVQEGRSIQGFLEEKNLKLDVKKLKEERWETLNNIYEKEIKLFSGLKELLEFLKNEKIKIGLVTTSPRKYVNIVLEKFKLKQYFEVIISSEDVRERKPNPEGFIKCLNDFRLDKKEVLILEDSEKGVIAAINAEIHCIAIPNEFTNSESFNKFLKEKNIPSVKNLKKVIEEIKS